MCRNDIFKNIYWCLDRYISFLRGSRFVEKIHLKSKIACNLVNRMKERVRVSLQYTEWEASMFHVKPRQGWLCNIFPNAILFLYPYFTVKHVLSFLSVGFYIVNIIRTSHRFLDRRFIKIAKSTYCSFNPFFFGFKYLCQFVFRLWVIYWWPT